MTDETHEPDEPLDHAQARARDAIAAPPRPLDDATRRRLVARALAERPQERRAPRPNYVPGLLAAAAAVAVVALGAWVLHSPSPSKGSAGSAGANSGGPPTVKLGSSLGDVSNPGALRVRVAAALHERSGNARTTSSPVAGRRCAAHVRTPAGVTATALATATYRGAPAVVFVARDGPETLIYVLDRRDCRLLTSQFSRG